MKKNNNFYCNTVFVLQGERELREKLYCNTTIVLQVGSWAECVAIGRNCIATGGWALGAGRATRRWAGVRVALGRARGRQGARQAWRAAGRAYGRQGVRQGRSAGRACGRGARQAGALGRQGSRQGRGSSAQGARGSQATGDRRAGKHGVGALGLAAGSTERAGHGRPRRGLGAGWVRRLGQLGQFWCSVHLAQFWLSFWIRFNSVFSLVTK